MNDPPSENTPLVGADSRSQAAQNSAGTAPLTGLSARQTALASHFWKWSTVYLCGLLIFTVDFPVFMGEVAKIRMLELGLCRDYYADVDPGVVQPDGSIPEVLCKIDSIQSRLANFRGYFAFLQGLPGKNLVAISQHSILPCTDNITCPVPYSSRRRIALIFVNQVLSWQCRMACWPMPKVAS